MQHFALEHSTSVIMHGADGGHLVARGQWRSFGATGTMAFSWLCATGPMEVIGCGRHGASGGQLVCATGPAEVIRGGRRGASGGQLAVYHGASGVQCVNKSAGPRTGSKPLSAIPYFLMVKIDIGLGPSWAPSWSYMGCHLGASMGIILGAILEPSWMPSWKPSWRPSWSYIPLY